MLCDPRNFGEADVTALLELLCPHWGALGQGIFGHGAPLHDQTPMGSSCAKETKIDMFSTRTWSLYQHLLGHTEAGWTRNARDPVVSGANAGERGFIKIMKQKDQATHILLIG